MNYVDEDDGRSALHWAAKNDHFLCAQALVNAGSALNSQVLHILHINNFVKRVDHSD